MIILMVMAMVLFSVQPDTHSHSHVQIDPSNITTHREIPNINAAWLAGGSIAKELLYRKTMQIAVQTNSKVLVANAWHHRVDSLTAVVAFVYCCWWGFI